MPNNRASSKATVSGPELWISLAQPLRRGPRTGQRRSHRWPGGSLHESGRVALVAGFLEGGAPGLEMLISCSAT